MSAARFFALAERLPAYHGVMRMRTEAEAVKNLPTAAPTAPAAPPSPAATGGDAEVIPFEAATAHAGFRGDGVQFPPVFSPM